MGGCHDGNQNMCETQDMIRLLMLDLAFLLHPLLRQENLLSTWRARHRPTCQLDVNYNILPKKEECHFLSKGWRTLCIVAVTHNDSSNAWVTYGVFFSQKNA